MAIDWGELLLVIGAVGGVIGCVTGMTSLVAWVHRWVSNSLSRPKLKISFDKDTDLITWQIYHNGVSKTWTRKFFNLQIENIGKNTAMRCEALVTVLDCPPSSTLLKGKYSIHWADTPYSGRTTGAYAVDIGSAPQRLDVVFSDNDNPSGAWLAVPFALLSPDKANQFFLSPGEYTINVDVSCSNGGSDSKQFEITSPQNWIDLDVAEI